MNNYRRVNDEFSISHQADALFSNWFTNIPRQDSCPDTHHPDTLVLKYQPLGNYYELTLLQPKRYLCDFERYKQIDRTRTENKELSPEDLQRSVTRAKQNVRKRCKLLNCDRLLTITLRENNPNNYKTLEQWREIWQKFTRKLRHDKKLFSYVAVFEKHKKGNYHLHAAINGYQDTTYLREVLYSIVGIAQGNIDISYKPRRNSVQRVDSIAKYISKYISKQIDQTEFNKKRYWSTKIPIPKPSYIIYEKTEDILQTISKTIGLNINNLQNNMFLIDQQLKLFWYSGHTDELTKTQLIGEINDYY